MPANPYAPIAAITANLRAPSAQPTIDAQGEWAFTFNPPLTAAEQTTLADIMTMEKFGITTNISLAEFQAIKSDLATARAFVGIASPTAAQSNAALKSTIRVLGALLRS